jgi:hypothetical protein
MNTSQSGYGLFKPALCFALVTMSSSSKQPLAVTFIPYKIVVPPNPKFDFMTMGIVPAPTFPLTKTNSAINLAAYAGQKIDKRRGQGIGVFVFKNVKSAKIFKAFQLRRRGRPLRKVDFVSLQSLWPKTLAYYESDKGKKRCYLPSKAPYSWWLTGHPPSSVLRELDCR